MVTFKTLALLTCAIGCLPHVCAGQTFNTFGVGTDSCSSYVSHAFGSPGQSVGRTAPDDGKDYYSKSTIYLEWVLGFVTGYNATVSDPRKQIKSDPASADLYVRNWCLQNPTSNILTAVHKWLDHTDPW
jgi:hypothetical protein